MSMAKYIILFFFLVTFGMAQTIHPCKCYVCPCQTSRIYVGANAYYLQMSVQQPEEGSILPDAKTLNGGLGGAEVGYEYKRIKNLYAALRGFYGQGEITNDEQSRYIHEIDGQLRLGFSYIALQGCNLVASFYTGLGFTYKNHYLKGFEQEGLKLRYYIYNIPVGLLLDLRITECIFFRFDFTWLPDVDPMVKYSFFPNIRSSLKHKQNFRVELPFVFLFGCKRNFEINIVPFWRRDKEGRTKRASLCDQFILLPEQVSSYWGAKLLFGFRF